MRVTAPHDGVGGVGRRPAVARRVRVGGDFFHGRVPDGAVYIGRAAPGLPGSLWRNPFRVGYTIGCDTPGDASAMYRDWLAYGTPMPYPRPGETAELDHRDEVLARLPELVGRDLACWCRLPEPDDDPCHGAVLLEAVREVTGCSR